MTYNRRSFIESAAAGAAAFAIAPGALGAAVPRDLFPANSTAEVWDLTWTDRLKGKHKAVFDNEELNSGYGVWRAAAWVQQNMDVLKAAPSEISPVVVLRHGAVSLAMQQAYWDKYGIGASKKITHPITGEPTTKNPVLLEEKDGLPPRFANVGLHKQIGRGAIVLACNLAFEGVVETVKNVDKVSDEEARKRAIAFLIPGVILQPSGVFAVIRAQEAGAAYIKAS